MIADKIKKQCRFCNFRNSKKNNTCETCGADVIDWYIEEDAIKQILEEIIRFLNEEVGDFKDVSWSYDSTIDITELPPGLIAEGKGVVKGAEGVRQMVLDYLKSELARVKEE